MVATATGLMTPTGSVTPRGPLHPGRLRLRFGTDSIFYLLVTAVVLFLVLVPLTVMIISSFRTGQIGLSNGVYTFHNWIEAYKDPANVKAMANSLIYATGSVAVSIAVAAPMAWAVERTNMPGRRLIFPAMLVPLAFPGMLFSISWILLLSPKIGFVNVILRNGLSVFGVHSTSGPLNIYTMPGMIFLEGIRHIPTVFLILAAAFRNMDSSLDEASAASGAGNFQTFRRVSLPILFPAILGAAIYSFMSSIESFEVPGIIGLPANIYVFSTRIYWAANVKTPQDIGLANAFGATFLLFSILLLWFYRRATRNAEAFATITGRGFRARPVDLGRWRFAPLAGFIVYFVVVVLLPLFILVWASGLSYFQVPSTAALSKMSFENYHDLVSLPDTFTSIKNTLILMVIAATVTMVLSFAASWISVRGRFRGGKVLDSISFLPHTIPSVVIGLALVVLYLGPLRFIPIYGTLGVIVIAMSTRYLAFGTRSANSALLQVHKELEEASYTSGATPVRTLRSVVVPLIVPAFVTGWIWVAMHAIREVSMPLMLSSSGNQIISTKLWGLWQDGRIGQAAAMGVVLILSLMVFAFVGEIVGRKVRGSGAIR